MEDARIWEMEEKLWHGGGDVYETLVDEDVVMALPAEPFIFSRDAAKSAVENTPRWEKVRFSDQKVTRPEEGLIVIGYQVEATRGEETYRCYASSTMRRRGNDDWTVVQHSQVVPPKVGLEARWLLPQSAAQPDRERGGSEADGGVMGLTDARQVYPVTADGRYFVVRGRLWRCSNPALDPQRRAELVRDLMIARRTRNRAGVDAAKRALGERGEPWWADGAPDWNRYLAKNTPYADWFASLG